MKYRNFEKSGIEASELGYGCWPIGGGWGAADDKRDIESLRLAHENGVTFFDTAMGYSNGRSEEVIRKAFGHMRDKVIISTKIGPKEAPAKSADEVYPYDWVIKCTEDSLKRFGTDYIDIQQIHCWRDHFTEESGWYGAMLKLKEQGKIRSIGVSAEDWEPYGAVRIAESAKIDSVQVIYNVFDQQATDKLFPAAMDAGTGIIVRVPLFEGLLAGKIKPGYSWEEGDWRKNFLTDERLKEAIPHLESISELTNDSYPTLAGLCLKFCLSHPAVTTVIVGMRNPKHVKANSVLSDGPDLNKETLGALKAQAWEHGWLYPWDSRVNK